MTTNEKNTSGSDQQVSDDVLVRARREKLQRWRETLNITGYGHRVDDLITLADARALFDRAASDEHDADESTDNRARAKVAGRIVQHRAMGKLVFFVIRDHSGDLQISVSKAAVDADSFTLAKKLDYGDIIVAEGPVGQTKREEICIWADALALHSKSLAPPPEKWHGLTDAELRYRQRYVDMYTNPETIATFAMRSRLVAHMRRYMDGRAFLEVETPMMQPLAGGAAARPFITHHNTLDIDLYLRVAPELYHKRLLVGGMPRVYEINRCFRNEGVDRSHNPEFTTLEAYQAFGDCWTMLELTETMLHELACLASGEAGPDAPGSSDSEHGKILEAGSDESARKARVSALPFGDITIDWSRPFDRVAYGDLFERTLGFPMSDEAKLRAKARELKVEKADTLDHWLLVNVVYEECCEPVLDPLRPTFVTDYPAAISPLTRPQPDNPNLCDRWELLVGGMELGTAYTELNDPDIQRAKLTEQLAGADDEESTFRTMDDDFINALCVGMPPAGGLGLGVDRIIMLMTNRVSIRDVILFPLLKPETT